MLCYSDDNEITNQISSIATSILTNDIRKSLQWTHKYIPDVIVPIETDLGGHQVYSEDSSLVFTPAISEISELNIIYSQPQP
jgi:hypothetical protein